MTRRTHTFAIAALLTGLASTAQAGESWHVVEGPDGRTTGVWTLEIKGNTVTGNANMITSANKPLKYGLTGTTDGTTWTFDRINPTDTILCTYQGSSVTAPGMKKPTEISGSAMCQAKTGMWKVRIMTAK